MTEEREFINQGDWWCVVDYDDSREQAEFVILRIGNKGSVNGEDFVVGVGSGEAKIVWGRLNNLQRGRPEGDWINKALTDVDDKYD